MSLAQFIHTGMFPNRTQRDNSAVKLRNVCIEGTYANWKDYYMHSKKMLSTPNDGRNYEVCDCWRPQAANMSMTFDNRYYRNSDANLSLSFISALDRNPILRANPPEYASTQPDWTGPIPDMLHGMKTGAIPLPNAKPTIVVWNTGIWKVYGPAESDTLRRISKAARELVESSGHPRPRKSIFFPFIFSNQAGDLIRLLLSL
jgi:hypothetical protein